MNVPPATGLLLIFPTLFVHYLEVTNVAMKLILEDLDRAVHNERVPELVIQIDQIGCRRSRCSTCWNNGGDRARSSRQTIAIGKISGWRTDAPSRCCSLVRDREKSTSPKRIAFWIIIIEIIHLTCQMKGLKTIFLRRNDRGTSWRTSISNGLIYCRIKVREHAEKIDHRSLLWSFAILVSINYLLKQPVFRTAEDILKNYSRPINIRFESGNRHPFIINIDRHRNIFVSDFTAPPTHRLFPIAF